MRDVVVEYVPYSRNNKLTSHLVVITLRRCAAIKWDPWTNNGRIWACEWTDCDFYGSTNFRTTTFATFLRCLQEAPPRRHRLCFQAYFTNRKSRIRFLRISEVQNNKNARPRRIRSLGIISFCTFAREGHFEGQSIRQRISLIIAPTRVSPRKINFPDRRWGLMRSPLSPTSLNRCTRKRSSRGPRSGRSCCPPAAVRDPCVGFGTPACGRDRRASIGILPWRARFGSAKASPADNRCARSAWLPAPSYPGTVLNLGREHKVVRLLRRDVRHDRRSTVRSYRPLINVQCFNKVQNRSFLYFFPQWIIIVCTWLHSFNLIRTNWKIQKIAIKFW